MYLLLVFIFSTGTAIGTFIGRLYGMLFADACCFIGLPAGYAATAVCVLFLLAPMADLHECRLRRSRIRDAGGQVDTD